MSDTGEPVAGQLTFKSDAEIEQWLAADPDGTAEELVRTVYLALRRIHTGEHGGGTFDHKIETFRLFRHRFGDTEELWNVLEAAQAEWVAAKLKADEERAKERQKRIAEQKKDRWRRQREEEQLRVERDKRADDVKAIAEHFGCTIRYAQMIRRDGVKDPKRAKELAGLLDSSISDFLKRKARPGRDPDLVARMMRIRPHGTSLRDYAEDDTELEGVALDALAVLSDVLDDCHSFEQLAAFANERGVDPDAIAIAWLNFKKWHIHAVAERAAQEVEDEIERRYPFG